MNSAIETVVNQIWPGEFLTGKGLDVRRQALAGDEAQPIPTAAGATEHEARTPVACCERNGRDEPKADSTAVALALPLGLPRYRLCHI